MAGILSLSWVQGEDTYGLITGGGIGFRQDMDCYLSMIMDGKVEYVDGRQILVGEYLQSWKLWSSYLIASVFSDMQDKRSLAEKKDGEKLLGIGEEEQM